MTTIVLRSIKGVNLTPTEVDTNFLNCKTDIEALQAAASSKANLLSPAFTGVPTAPTAAAATNTTQLATMAALFNERSNTVTLQNHTISGVNNTLTAIPASQISGVIPIANLATGVPTGAKFIRDDGTLQAIAGGGNALTGSPLSQFAATTSAQLAGVMTDESGTGALLFGTAPSISALALSGTATGTAVMPTTWTMAATPAQADNSLKVATTAYVDTGLSTKATANAAVAISGSNTLTQASHFNRHVSWTGGAGASQAISATATAGDLLEVSNDGTALLTFTGASIAAGYRLTINPGETFYAVYSNSAWVSLTPVPVYQSPVQSISAAYTMVAADAGTTLYHPTSDATPRTWTIPSNASVAYPIGTIITIDNDVGSALTIAITTDTLVLVGAAGSTGSRALAAGGRAVLEKVTATRWRISGSAELT